MGKRGEQDGRDLIANAVSFVGWPVIPLGHIDSKRFYYLGSAGSVVALGSRDYNRISMLGLFGREQQWLEDNHPKWNRDGSVVTGWDHAKVAESMVLAARDEGPFLESSIRGTGVWRDEAGYREHSTVVIAARAEVLTADVEPGDVDLADARCVLPCVAALQLRALSRRKEAAAAGHRP